MVVLVVRILCFHHSSPDSIPGLETEIPSQAMHTVAKKKKKKKGKKKKSLVVDLGIKFSR